MMRQLILAFQKGRRFKNNNQGVAAVEFALIAPVFIIFLLGIIDAGFAIYTNMQVQTSSHAGMQYAVARGYNVAGITSAITNATTASNISVPFAPIQFCGCPSETGVVGATCGGSCPDGGVAGTYVSVFARGTYTTLLSYPIIPNSLTFTEQSTVRIR